MCPDNFYENYPKSTPAPFVACDLPSPCDTLTFGSYQADYGELLPPNNPAALDCIVAGLTAGTPGRYVMTDESYISGHTYTIRRYAEGWAGRRTSGWEDSTSWFEQEALEAVPGYDFGACAGLLGYAPTRNCIRQGFVACTVWDEDSGSSNDTIGTWNISYAYGLSTGQKTFSSSGRGCGVDIFVTVTKVRDLYD